jgi:hypothetical protein
MFVGRTQSTRNKFVAWKASRKTSSKKDANALKFEPYL